MKMCIRTGTGTEVISVLKKSQSRIGLHRAQERRNCLNRSTYPEILENLFKSNEYTMPRENVNPQNRKL